MGPLSSGLLVDGGESLSTLISRSTATDVADQSPAVFEGTGGILIEEGSGSGSGDVVGPSSATDGHLAVFDGSTGKLIKDGGTVPSGVFTGTIAVNQIAFGSGTDVLAGNAGFTFVVGTGLMSIPGNLALVNGAAITGDSTDAHTWSLNARDIDGSATQKMIEFTNGNTPIVNVTSPNGLMFNSLPIALGFSNTKADSEHALAVTANGIGGGEVSLVIASLFTNGSTYKGLRLNSNGSDGRIEVTDSGGNLAISGMDKILLNPNSQVLIYAPLQFQNNATIAPDSGKTLAITGTSIKISGDDGGTASQNTLTNVTDTTTTNAYVVKGGQTAATPNTGWKKEYIGTAVVWIPYWANATP